jgi:hypothetical protein
MQDIFTNEIPYLHANFHYTIIHDFYTNTERKGQILSSLTTHLWRRRAGKQVQLLLIHDLGP